MNESSIVVKHYLAISEISATTKGINLSYDENGNIQSYTMDKTVFNLEAIR